MPTFDFATSCSLAAPLTAENVIIGYGLASEYLDYSNPGFFSNMMLDTHDDYGLLLQAAAVKYGRGRVVAFTDSTVFSNYSMFFLGKPELALGVMEYLNRSNLYADLLNCAFLALAFIALGLAIYCLRKLHRMAVVAICLSAGVLSFGLSAWGFGTLNRTAYPLPCPHTDFTRICFVQDHSDFSLPGLLDYRNPESAFDTFYVWTQRLGYIPSVEPSLSEALEKGDVIVLINPVGDFTAPEIEATKRYIEQGGKVLLLDSVLNQNSTANQLLYVFGMQTGLSSSSYLVSENTPGQKSEENESERNIGTISTPLLSIWGGEPLLADDEERVLVSVTRRGEGMLMVMTDSFSFSRAGIGYMYRKPEPFELEMYEIEFYIFNYLLQEGQ